MEQTTLIDLSYEELLKRDNIIRVNGENAYAICVLCNTEFTQVNEYDNICWECRKKREDQAYSVMYNKLAKSGIEYNKINRIMLNMATRETNPSIKYIFVQDHANNGKILYYHMQCDNCKTLLERKDFFCEITDYCCTLFYHCSKCHKYPVTVH